MKKPYKLWRQSGINKYTSKIDKYNEKQELAKCIKQPPNAT